jgi:Rrf2 family protein
MKISKLEEQSIRLVVALAKGPKQMTLPMLAEAEHFSEALVAKIMGQLRNGGIIKAARGRAGGYELAHAPEALTVAAIIRSLGKPILEGCVSVGSSSSADMCPHIADCSLRPIWQHLQSEITETLDRITVSELLSREQGMRKHLARLKAS